LRLNWSSRQSPSDLDEPPQLEPVLDFDIQRNNEYGRDTWPKKYFGQTFGPSLINKAIRAGKYVVADIEGFPRPVVVTGARWVGPVLEVLCAEGYRIPQRIWTLETLKGFKV
jgi:hypothetical protein